MGNWPGVRVMVRAFVWQGVKMGVRVLWSWGYVSIWLIKIVSDCFLWFLLNYPLVMRVSTDVHLTVQYQFHRHSNHSGNHKGCSSIWSLVRDLLCQPKHCWTFLLISYKGYVELGSDIVSADVPEFQKYAYITQPFIHSVNITNFHSEPPNTMVTILSSPRLTPAPSLSVNSSPRLPNARRAQKRRHLQR